MGTDQARQTYDGPADSVVDVVDSPKGDVTQPDATKPDVTSDPPPATEPDSTDPPTTTDPDDQRPAPVAAGEDQPGTSAEPVAEAVPEPASAAPTSDRPAPSEEEAVAPAGWSRPSEWQPGEHPGEPPPPELTTPEPAPHELVSRPDQLAEPLTGHPEEPGEVDEYDDYEEYDDGALLTTIFSAPSLALAAFVFALTGLLGGMIPESLPYLVQIDPTNGPAYHVRIVGLIALGFAIVAASLGLAAMLRSIGSPLRWPRYLGGAAVLLALLIALQSVLLIVLAGLAPTQGGLN